MKKNESYMDSVHRVGRIGSLIAVAFMVGIPVLMCAIFDCFPKFAMIAQAAMGILAMMIPADFSEIIGYAPILGSSSYITFITGNVMNLKLPVIISAQQIAGVEANTEESDAISSYAVAISSIETIIIIALDVLLLKPMEPLFELPAVKTATQYVIPALFGSLLLGLFAGGSSGEHYVKNKNLIVIAPVVATILALIFIPGMANYQGFAIMGGIVIAIGWAYVLYRKGIVKMVQRTPQD